jgi:two-component system sensor histidine kinase DesK
MREDTGPGRLVWLATGAVVIYAVVVTLLSLVRYLHLPPDQVRGGVVVLVLFTAPATAWLVHAAARGLFHRVHIGLLAALVLVDFGLVWVMGPSGWGLLYAPSALIAVALSQVWSVTFLVGLAAVPAPLAAALGHRDYALFWTLGIPFAVLPLVLAVRLIRAVRWLETARQELAREAIVRERLRIDGDLSSTVAVALTGIVEQGERLKALIVAGSPTADPELRALSTAARRSLAEARRLVRGYREVTLRAELETAGTILAAAGIRVRMEPDGGPRADRLDATTRAALRSQVIRLLATGDPPDEIVLPIGERRPYVQANDPRGLSGAGS